MRKQENSGLVEPVHFKKKMVFGEWRLQNGETVRVTTDRSNGFDLIHIRRWEGGPGRLHPTEKGIAIAVGDLPRLRKALKEVAAYAREIGLLPAVKHQGRN
jgi:hypothetical protein